MVKRFLHTSLVLLAFAGVLRAQVNLVPNPSFEEYSDCPNDQGKIDLATGWENIGSPNVTSPDYLNICNNAFSPSYFGIPGNIFGNQNPFDGDAYAGVFVFLEGNYQTEYISIELQSKLKKNNKYCLTFYVSLSERSQYTLNNIGVALTINKLIQPGSDRVILQNNDIILKADTTLNSTSQWMKVSFEFIANGNENYLTIGNFNAPNTDIVSPVAQPGDLQAAYYFIDNVSLVCCDTSGCISNNADYNVIFPNPATNAASVKYTLPSDVKHAILDVFDSVGRIIHTSPLTGTIGIVEIPTYNLSKGIYYVRIKENNNILWGGKLSIP